MATTLTTSGSNSTVTIRYTATSQRVTDTLTAAAEYWHNLSGSEIAFADLTAAQKLEVVDAFILRVIQDAARTQHILAAQKTATDTAQGEIPGKFM